MIRISICFFRPCYENHSPYTALAFYNIPRSNSFNNDYYPDDLYIKIARDYASKNTTDKIKEPEIEISTLFSIQSEFIDEFYIIYLYQNQLLVIDIMMKRY
jgi:hypothetical protein